LPSDSVQNGLFIFILFQTIFIASMKLHTHSATLTGTLVKILFSVTGWFFSVATSHGKQEKKTAKCPCQIHGDVFWVLESVQYIGVYYSNVLFSREILRIFAEKLVKKVNWRSKPKCCTWSYCSNKYQTILEYWFKWCGIIKIHLVRLSLQMVIVLTRKNLINLAIPWYCLPMSLDSAL
jgi:hypothetical protein